MAANVDWEETLIKAEADLAALKYRGEFRNYDFANFPHKLVYCFQIKALFGKVVSEADKIRACLYKIECTDNPKLMNAAKQIETELNDTTTLEGTLNKLIKYIPKPKDHCSMAAQRRCSRNGHGCSGHHGSRGHGGRGSGRGSGGCGQGGAGQ